MAYSTFVALAMLFGVLAWLVLLVTYDAYSRWSEPTVVHCPSTNTPAALTTSFDGVSVRVLRCSHWPTCQGCNESCLEPTPVRVRS